LKVVVDGLSIYYEAQGKGQPVVLLHGWGVDSSNLRRVSSLLKNAAGARVYSVDLPGFGYSDPPPQDWDISAYVQFLADFLASQELGNVSLLGHSFGGRIAIKYTAEHPGRVEKLVLVDGAGIKPKRKASYYYKVGLAKLVKNLRKAFPALQNSRLLPQMGSADYQKAGALRGTFVKVVNEDLRPYLPAIRCPTLLIWGEKDQDTPLADARIMQGLIVGAQLEIIPGAGHFSFQDNFAAFERVLPSFMNQNNTSEGRQ
jgi:pimeloyl-ACP methyl ester carboxylesterase